MDVEGLKEINAPEELGEEYILEDQDLRLLKGILSSDKRAMEFVAQADSSLFMGDAKPFARRVIDYVKTYKCSPTKRILLESEDNPTAKLAIDFIWDAIENIQYNDNEFRYDLDKMRDRFAQNKILSLKDNLENINIEESIDWEKTLREIRSNIDEAEQVKRGQKAVYTQKTLREYMPEFRDEFGKKAKDPELGKGIFTGYSYLDYVTNGLFPSQLLIVAAETGAGKSLWLNNVAIQMWMQKNTIYTDSENFGKGHNVLYFSLEMPFEACARRTMARLSDLPIYGIRDAKIAADKIDQLNRAANFIRKYPYEFEIVDIPRGVSVEQIESRYNEAVYKGRPPEIVVVDYIGLMEAPDVQQAEDWLKLGYIAGKLHEFARAYDVTVLSAVQLNRAQKAKESSELIGMHRIGRSSLIMHHANIGIQIESRQDEHTYSDLRYHIIKNRDGQLGMHTLMKKFQNATIKDFDEPYKSPEETVNGLYESENSMEDISAALERVGWYNKNE